MRRSSVIQSVAAVAISSGALYIFFRGTDPKNLLHELSSLSAPTIFACAALSIISMIFRSLRWRLLLPDAPGTHKRNLFSHTIIGFMVNNIVPARVGEAARILLLWKKNSYPLATSAGSLVLERALDVLVFLPMFALPVIFLPRLRGLLVFGWLVMGIFVMGVLLLAICGFYPGIIPFITKRLSFMLPKRFHVRLEDIGRDISLVLYWIKLPIPALLVIVLSIAVWLSASFSVVLLAGKFSSFGILEGMFVISFAVVGCAIPLSPGFIGTLHAAVLQSLVLLGLDPEAGRALAVLVHATGYIPVTVVGFIYFLRADLSFREISKPRSC